MREREGELRERGIAIVLVSFAPPPLASRWQSETGFDWPILLDPERRLYRSFGLAAPILTAWHPKMFLYYLRLLLRGRRLMPVRQNPYQLGGDFLLDAQGVFLLAHRSRDPLDRPRLEEIFAASSLS